MTGCLGGGDGPCQPGEIVVHNRCVLAATDAALDDGDGSAMDGSAMDGGVSADGATGDAPPLVDATIDAGTECATDVDCADRFGVPICDPVSGTCVAAVGLCAPCEHDAECAAGQLCVSTELDADGAMLPVSGTFCQWVEGGEGGAPASCSASGRPFVRRRAGVRSVDGVVAAVCGLRMSTCAAYLAVDAPCNLGDDASCGEPGLEDARCVDRDSGAGADPRCAPRCAAQDDCPSGFACDAVGAACVL